MENIKNRNVSLISDHENGDSRLSKEMEICTDSWKSIS